MTKPKCPSCKREGTYSAKFDQCSGCGRGYENQPAKRIQDSRREQKPVIGTHTKEGEAIVTLTPGEPCPTCGKPVGKTSAQLQREYRERKKGKEVRNG